MEIDPTDPKELSDDAPDLKQARGVMSKEWLMVFGFVAVVILIVALTAWHLTHGN